MKTLCEVMDSGIDDNSLFSVLAALAHHKNNKTGDCFPSIPTIIRTSRLSENTVVKSLKRLKALGYISWTQEPGKKRFYQIHLGSLPKSAPPEKMPPFKSEPSTKLGGHPPQNCWDTLPKSGGTPSPNLPPEPGSNQELNQEGNQESSLSRLDETLPLFDGQPQAQKDEPKQAKKTRTKKPNTLAEKPDDVDEQVWNDFLTVRKAKRAPVTPTAVEGIQREAQKAGISLNEAIKVIVTRGWHGFSNNYGWKTNSQPQRQTNRPLSRERMALHDDF